MARIYTPEDFGKISYILSFSSLFIPLFTLGSDDWFLGKMVQSNTKDTHENLINEAIGTRVYGSLFGVTICLVSLAFFSTSKEIFILIALLTSSYSFKTFDSLSIFLTAKENIKQQSRYRTTIYLFSSFFKVTLAFSGVSYQAIIAVSIAELLLFAISYILAFKSAFPELKIKFHRPKYIQTVLLSCIPMTFLSFVTIGLTRIDQIMIGNLINIESVAKYSVAVKLIELWQFLPVIMTTVFLPRILSNSKDQNILKERKGSLLFSLLLISSLFSIIVYFLASPLILLIYSEKYLSSIPILKTYLWQSILFFLFMAKQKFLLAEGQIRLALFYCSLALLSNILLNLSLIPIHGITGAIYASLVSVLISEFILSSLNKEFRKGNLMIISSINLKKTYRNLQAVLNENSVK